MPFTGSALLPASALLGNSGEDVALAASSTVEVLPWAKELSRSLDDASDDVLLSNTSDLGLQEVDSDSSSDSAPLDCFIG